jgi:hypothetical protein
VVNIIENISFKGGHEAKKFTSLELDIVQDALRRSDSVKAVTSTQLSTLREMGAIKSTIK